MRIEAEPIPLPWQDGRKRGFAPCNEIAEITGKTRIWACVSPNLGYAVIEVKGDRTSQDRARRQIFGTDVKILKRRCEIIAGLMVELLKLKRPDDEADETD